MKKATNQNLGSLKNFLEKHPDFDFDIYQYLQSIKYVEYLHQRANLYHEYHNGKLASPLSKASLMHDLKSSLVDTIPEYSGYNQYSTFDELPFTSKKNFCKDDYPFVRRSADGKLIEGDLWHTTTFGTTASPVSLFYSPPFYYEYLFLTIWKITRYFGKPDANNTIYAICIDDNLEKPEFVINDPSGFTGIIIRVLVDKMAIETIDRVFKLINELHPAVIITRPSLFEVLIAYGKCKKLKMITNFKCGFSAGSFLSENTRHEVEELISAPVFNCYGLSEFGFTAGECKHKCGYHIDATSVLLELLDSNGNQVDDGVEGEVILSSTINSAMPLLRFRTGDFAMLDHSRCQCGSSIPRLTYVKGHGPFHYRMDDGSLIHPARFYPLKWLFPIREFQVIEETNSIFQINVDPISDLPQNVLEDIKTFSKHILNPRTTIKVIEKKLVEEPNFKRFMTIDKNALLGRD